MSSDSYAKSLESVLKTARDREIETPPQEVSTDREELLRAAALVAVFSMVTVVDERSHQGRSLGPAWSQDHRRTRMGTTNVLENRRKRSTWR